MSRILIIDDQPVVRAALARLLERNGYDVTEAGTVREASAARDLLDTDLIIADLRPPGALGTDAVGLVDHVPVLIMINHASMCSAVESMKPGAVDYIAKPFDHDQLLLSVRRILSEAELERQNRALKSDLARIYPVTGMIGSCPAMRAVFSRIDELAPTDTAVLVTGESGTGKELVARALHERSSRANAPMINVNCAASPTNRVECELFGHGRGAFAGAVGAREGGIDAAARGTLFLDEIAALSLDAQARLLRVQEEREIRRVGAPRSKRIDVRLIAATSRNLEALVSAGAFREDLYLRLHAMKIELPPLRARGDDVIELADSLLARSCERLHRPALALDAGARNALRSHDWPGNVRELEHAIERAAIRCESATIPAALLGARTAGRGGATGTTPPCTGLSLEGYFRAVVTEHEGEMTETQLAGMLGISRKALWERRQRLGMPRKRAR